MGNVCSKCGTALNDGAKFCAVCGTQVQLPPKNLFCMNCGAQLNEGARFCMKCGTAVSEKPVTMKKPEEPKVCSACGNPLKSDSRFCLKCGASVAMNVVNMAKKIFQHQTVASPYPGETLCSAGQVGDMQLTALINAVKH